jgi:hypothetical protein
MLKNKRWAYLAGITALLAVGCAKEAPYELTTKINTASTQFVKKSELPCMDPADPCIYVPSNVKSSRYIQTGTIPYHMGASKLVNFRINEDSIAIVDIEKEKQFGDNDANSSLAISIPVDHKSYRCKEDSNGDCGNAEEENTDIPWNQKTHLKVDFSGMKVTEFNNFSAMIGSLWGCASEIGNRVIKTTIDNGALNVTVERDFKYGIVCLDSTDDIFRESNFTVQYHYSFVPLSKISSPDYQPVAYTDFDEDKFGFFKTETSKLSVDNHDQHQSHEFYMNRWNPKKKEIVYYLNDAFYKPELKHMLHATKVAINNINQTLKNSKVNLRVKIKDGRGKDTGDIRNNFIIMVDDPQSSGILGYAPTAKNPNTGEIIHGRAMMYYGTIAKYVSSAYIELYNELKDQARLDAIVAAGQSGNNTPEAKKVKQAAKKKNNISNALASLVDKMRLKSGKSNGLTLAQAAGSIKAPSLTNPLNQTSLSVDTLDLESINNFNPEKMLGLRSDMSFENGILKFDQEKGLRVYDFYSTNNAYHGDLFNFAGVMSGALNSAELNAFKKPDGTLRDWFKLSQTQRKEIIDIVMPFVWVPTLVHELGHTLGLRHNFYGSVDTDNWYSKDELSRINVKQEVPFSSVMDYPGTQVNELPVMGKYDIAALRFAYNREIEKEDGSMLKIADANEEGENIKNPLAQALAKSPGTLKAYMYCSDEHVSGSPQCNRHDLGTTYVEIAQFYMDSYDKRYINANKRNDRSSFSAGNDMGYAGGVNYYMRNLRSFFETYDNIKGIFGVSDEGINEAIEADTTGQLDWLKDIRDAMLNVADFYIDQVATPGQLCVVQSVTDANADPIVVPLKQIASGKGKSVATCFDSEQLQLPNIPGTDMPAYAVIAEAGKHINNKKDNRSDHFMTSYADQIDVRGTWMDKVFAMRYLTRRQLGSIHDSSIGNFLDIPAVRAKVLNKINEFAMNNVKGKLTLRDENGDILNDRPIEYSFPIDETHRINGSLFSSVNKYFGLAKGDDSNFLMRNLIHEVTNGAISNQDRQATEDLAALFKVSTVSEFTDIDESKFMTVQLGDTIFAAGKRNVLAQNTMMMVEFNTILDAVENKVIQGIIAERNQQDLVTKAEIDNILNQGDEVDDEVTVSSSSVSSEQNVGGNNKTRKEIRQECFNNGSVYSIFKNKCNTKKTHRKAKKCSNKEDFAWSAGECRKKVVDVVIVTPDSPEVVAAKQLPTQVLQMYVDGEIPPTSHLHEVLFSLAPQ